MEDFDIERGKGLTVLVANYHETSSDGTAWKMIEETNYNSRKIERLG